MAFTMPEIFKISVAAACPSHSRTDVSARQHTIVIDEPPHRGGTDVAQTPLETLLASFLGCTNVIANMIAEDMGIEIDNLSLSLTAKLDTRGVFDKARVKVPFPEIALTVDVTTEADDAQIEELKTALARRCPVSTILRQSGSQVIETWNVTRP